MKFLDLLKKGIAEFIGTFVLVFAACGVAAYTNGSLVATSLAFGLVIVAMAYTIGRISGCHINPAVSLAMLITKRMNFLEFIVYVACQFLGAIIGGIVMFGVVKGTGAEPFGNACNYFINSPQYGYYGEVKYVIDAAKIFWSCVAEVVLTCIFVYVILNVTSKKSESTSKIAGLIIGLTLTLVHLVGINLTGTSVNPARSFGTVVGDMIFNQKFDALAQYWLFLFAPLIGAAIAAVLYIFLHWKDNSENVVPVFNIFQKAPKEAKAEEAKEEKVEEIKEDAPKEDKATE